MFELFMNVLKALGWYLLGFLIVPVLCLATPQGAKRWRWLDSIYGNKIDGLDGDAHYRATVKRFRRFRWTQLRNPINNLLRAYGPNGVVMDIRHTEKGHYRRVDAVIGGRDYWMVTYRLWGRLHLWLGYALIDDDRTGSKVKIGHHFENRMLLWPLKTRRFP